MIASADPQILTDAVQWGFAGFAVMLLGIIVWRIREQDKILMKTQQVIEENTEAFKKMTQVVERLVFQQDRFDQHFEDLRNLMLTRKCMAVHDA